MTSPQLIEQSNETPVVSEYCDEPEGRVLRHVYRMDLSPHNLRTFWERSKQFRTLFTDDIDGNFKKFMECFVSQEGDELRAHGLFWKIDNFTGVYYLTHISEFEAQCHYTFFDRRHLGREKLTRAIIAYVFDRYGFRRMNVEVPKYASKHTYGFVYSLGFKKEGEKRKAALYKGDWFDVCTFGILREEALNGN